MVFSTSTRKTYFTALVGLAFTMLLLSACGHNTSAAPISASQNKSHNAEPTETVPAIAKLITFVGQPKSKMVTGTTFEVVGQLKNGDTYQHDITVQARLLDASGKTIATATKFLDNVKAGSTVSYSISGSTPQPTWTNVQVAIIKVTENINGSGDD